MGKARPVVMAWALASSATPPAGRTRILHRLVKLVILEATFAAPGHGRARPACAFVQTKAHAGQGIICRPVPGSGEPPSYLGGRLPALFAIMCLHFMFLWFLDQDIPLHPKKGCIRIQGESSLWEECLGNKKNKNYRGSHYMHGAAQRAECEQQFEFFTKVMVGPRTRADHVIH